MGPALRPAASTAESSRRTGRAQIGALLDELERTVMDFRLEFGKFFAGDRAIPPEDVRTALLAQIRNLRGMTIQAVADNFRLTHLEAQFNTHNELFNRRLRQREEGGSRAARRSPASKPSDAAAGIRVDASLEAGAVAALYRSLYSASQGADFERFREYLANQLQGIREKTGCAAVVFRVASEDGRLKLKARPVQDEAGA